MEPSQTSNALPSVLILSQSIGDALTMAKSIYLKSYTLTNEKLHGRLCENIINIKVDAPFVSEEYTLDTNYYNCNVRLACFSYGSFIPILDSENFEEALLNHGISSVEGLIFVSNLKPKQEDGVNQYLKYNKEVIDKLNPEFMMCFANTEATNNDDLFEIFKFGENEMFVEVVNDDLDVVEAVRPDLSVPKPKFEEKYGIDRVIENIECHMWPNMVRKDVQKSTGDKKSVIEKPKEPVNTVEERKENKEVHEVAEKVQEKDNKEDKVNEKPKEDKKVEEAAKPVKEASAKDKTVEKAEKKSAEAKDVPKPEANPLEYVDEDENELVDLAAVLETVRQFKMSSKDLSDETRREKAAELIMKLVANCKELQEGSDGEDEDD